MRNDGLMDELYSKSYHVLEILLKIHLKPRFAQRMGYKQDTQVLVPGHGGSLGQPYSAETAETGYMKFRVRFGSNW